MIVGDRETGYSRVLKIVEKRASRNGTFVMEFSRQARRRRRVRLSEEDNHFVDVALAGLRAEQPEH